MEPLTLMMSLHSVLTDSEVFLPGTTALCLSDHRGCIRAARVALRQTPDQGKQPAAYQAYKLAQDLARGPATQTDFQHHPVGAYMGVAHGCPRTWARSRCRKALSRVALM